jgi:hypothetical protein
MKHVYLIFERDIKDLRELKALKESLAHPELTGYQGFQEEMDEMEAKGRKVGVIHHVTAI